MILTAILSWAVVTLSSSFMRQSPDYESPLENQMLMGALVETREASGYWVKVQAEDYVGWVTDLGIKTLTDSEKDAYLAAPKWICTADCTHIRTAPSRDAAPLTDFIMGDLVRKTGACCTRNADGCCKSGNTNTRNTDACCKNCNTCTRNTDACCKNCNTCTRKGAEGWTCVLLPDGRKGWVESSCIADFGSWAAATASTRSADTVTGLACSFLGTPYMWGGNTSKHFDCSGLVKLCYFMNGIILPRNASQQCKCGTPVTDGQYRKGDLLFFGKKNPLRVTHVGIYIGDGKIVHSSHLVRINTLEEYGREVVAATRILGTEDQGSGAVSIVNSPYYFPQNGDKE